MGASFLYPVTLLGIQHSIHITHAHNCLQFAYICNLHLRVNIQSPPESGDSGLIGQMKVTSAQRVPAESSRIGAGPGFGREPGAGHKAKHCLRGHLSLSLSLSLSLPSAAHSRGRRWIPGAPSAPTAPENCRTRARELPYPPKRAVVPAPESCRTHPRELPYPPRTDRPTPGLWDTVTPAARRDCPAALVGWWAGGSDMAPRHVRSSSVTL